MEKNVRFPLAMILSVIYVFFSLFGFSKLGVIGYILPLVVFPIIIKSLESLIIHRYELQQKTVFNIVFVAIILSYLMPIIAFFLFVFYQSGITAMINFIIPIISILLRGSVFLILGIWLFKHFKLFNSTLKLIVISFLLIGIENIFSSILLLTGYVIRSNNLANNILHYSVQLQGFSFVVLLLSLFLTFDIGYTKSTND